MLINFKLTVSVQRISEDAESGKITVSPPEEIVETVLRDVSDELSMYIGTFCARRSDEDLHYSVPDALLKVYRKKVVKSTGTDNPDDIMDQLMYDDFMESLQDYVEAEWQRKESQGASLERHIDAIRSVCVHITGISVEEK